MGSWGVGETLPIVEKVISLEQLTDYSRVSGDHNALHLDAQYAATTQFGGIIAHGMLTLAFISEMLTVAFGRDWLATGRLKVRLKAPAYPGDTVRTWGAVVSESPGPGHRSLECSVGLSNGRGEELIRGSASLSRTLLPEEKEAPGAG